MTRARKRILGLLDASQVPLSAASLCSETAGEFDQATVYRNLHRLEESGLVESFVLHCQEHGTERFWHTQGESRSHRHWFHYELCHAFTDLGECFMDEVSKGYQNRLGLRIRTHTLYFTGICSACSGSQHR